MVRLLFARVAGIALVEYPAFLLNVPLSAGMDKDNAR